MPESPALTPAEAARKLRVSVGTLRNWAREGRIHFFRTPGGDRRYSRQQVEALLAELNVAGDAYEDEPDFDGAA